MDTIDHGALAKAHQYLSDDLAKVSQFIQPQNQQALATLCQAQRRLEDIQERVKHASRTEAGGNTVQPPDESVAPRMSLSDINPLLHSNVDDTMAHVNDALTVLGEVALDDGTPEGFRGGMGDLLYLLNRTLQVHIDHGHKLPDDVVLKQADWQLDLQRRAS